jgi:hypothetical protein
MPTNSSVEHFSWNLWACGGVREFAQSYSTSNETKQQMVMQFQRKSTLPSKKRRGVGLDFLIFSGVLRGSVFGDFLRVRAFSVKKNLLATRTGLLFSFTFVCLPSLYECHWPNTTFKKKKKKEGYI